MAKDEYVPFTGKLDAAPQFEPFDGTLDGEKPNEPGLVARVKQGASRAFDSARTALTDDPNQIAQIAAEQARTALPQTATQRKMAEEIAPYSEAASKAEGVVDNVKAWGALGFKRAGQLVSNPAEAGKMIAEQLPNSLPGIAGGFAGAKAGAALGSFAGPVGTAVGGIGGAILGGFAGGYGLEKGAAVQEQVQKQAQERGIDVRNEAEVSKMLQQSYPEIEAAAQRKGLGTAGTDAVLNAATMGLAGVGGRTLAKEASALAKGVKAGTVSAADAATELARLEAINAARNTLKARALRGTGVVGAEMAGEGLSEAAGQKLAYGEVNPGEVIDEALLGLGSGGVMALGSKAFNKAAGVVDQDAATRDLAAARDGLPGLGPNFTTTPGAADPNAPVPPGAAPVEAPEAPDLTTSPGAGVARDGIDFTREVDTSGLSLQDPAELERARAATVDYQPGDTTPQWETSMGAAATRQGLDMPAPEFDTDGLGLDPIRQMVKQAADAGGALSTAAGVALDLGATNAQFLGATGRDVQLRQTGPGVTDESNVIDVDAREVQDQRGLSIARRLTNEQEGGARAASSQPLAIPAPTNLREGLERIRAQRQEAANAQAAAQSAPTSALAVSTAQPGAVEADGEGGEFSDLFDEQGRARFSNASSVKEFKKRTGLGQDGVRAIQAAVQDGRPITLEDARQADIAGIERRNASLEQSKAESEAESKRAKENATKPAEQKTLLGDYEIPGLEGAISRVRVFQQGERIEAVGLDNDTANNDLSRLVQAGQTVEQALATLYGDHGPNEAPNPSRVKRADRSGAVDSAVTGSPAPNIKAITEGSINVPQTAQAQQSIAQPTQAGGAATAGPAAAATAGQSATVGGSGVQAAGMTAKRALYDAYKATGSPDDVVAASVLKVQEKADALGAPVSVWRGAGGTIGVVPASQSSPFKGGELIATLHPNAASAKQPQEKAATTENPGAQGTPAPGAQAQAPQTAVARPDGWRKSMLKAGPVAKAMGIDTKGKRLAQVVAEIDAADARRAGVRQDGADLAAGKIDRQWSAFAPETGTLGVPRADMPQIKAEHRGALVNFLKARGIDSRPGEVPANDLKPTQAEFSPAKVEKARAFQGGDRSILVSADGYVVDGHHQWLAKRANGEPVKVIRLQAPIRQVLAQTAEFPSTTSARGAQTTQGAADAATPRDLRLADERAPGAAAPAQDGAGPAAGGAAPAVGDGRRAGGSAAQPAPAVRAAVPDAGGAGESAGGVVGEGADRPAKAAATETVAQPITRADVEDAQQQASADNRKKVETKEDDTGNVAMFSRTPTTQAAIGTPAATIRAAITKAYGKLLDQLESKGLVTLTQTEDEAIEAAAQARAAKTGQSVEQARSTLRASVKNSVADQTQTENFQRWFKDSKVVDADGNPLVMYHGTSASEQGDAFSSFDTYASNYGLMGQGGYFTADPEVASSYTTKGKGATPSVYPVYLAIKNPIDMDAQADPVQWQKQFDGIEDFHEGGTTNESWYRAAEDMLRDQELPMWEGAEIMQDGLRSMGFDGITHEGGGRVAVDGVRHRVYIAFDPEQIKSATGNNGDFDPANPDIRRSADGSIQGFFDPQTGQSFLIADNLTAEAAPGVLMHEVGIHMAADGSMKALFNRAAMMLKLQRGNPFMKAVQDRMDAAGETSGEEAAAYIAEAYENDRANAPASVQRWLADLLAAVKAWMFKKGIMGADRLTVADIAAVARANARSMARGGGATGWQGFGPAFSVGEEVGAKALAEFAKADELFALPKSTKDTVEGIAADNDAQFTVSKPASIGGRLEYTVTLPDGTKATLSVREPNPFGGEQVYDARYTDDGMELVPGRPGENPDDVPPTGDVWIDVSDLKKGDFGAKMYNIAATYAHNTGRIFIGDPHGLSKDALRRRLEQMISSALKFGTTAHLAPHPDQTRGGHGVPPLRWVYGDHVGNVERMIAASVKALDNGFPQSKLIEYRDGNFYNANNGKLLPRGRLATGLGESIAQRRSVPGAEGSTAQAGWRTVARAALFRHFQSSIMDAASGIPQRGSLLARGGKDVSRLERGEAGEGAFDANERIFYSRAGVNNTGGQAAESTQEPSSTTAAGVAARMGDAIKSVTVTNIKQRAGFKAADYLGLGLQALGRRQIVDIYGDLVPLAEYNRLVQQMEADKNEGGAEADQLVTRWSKLPDEKKLADLMHDATLAQIDPAKPYVDGDDKARYMQLKGQYGTLSDEAKKVYTDTRDAYQGHHNKVRNAIKERIERSELKGERKRALLQQMDGEFFKAVKGVYFPLARFGQYAVTVKGPDGKVESVSRAETKAEAEALRNNLLTAFPRDNGFTVGRVMLSKDFIADRDAVGRGFMTELYQVLDKQDMDAAQRAELEDTLGQLYLSSLPDLSWAKHGIHRKGTPGFSQDARRAFAQNMFHGARYLAKLRYSDLMQDELAAMQKHVDDWREVEDFDQNSAQRVVDEMNKRHESLMNPKSNALSTALTSLGFIFHLGLSPASAMVNLSQTALVAYPIMGAKWGFNKASAALLKASAEAAKGKNDITGSLNADERAAYDEAVRAGTIDVTMAHDLAGIAQGEDAGVMWKIRPVMRWASFLFHHAERFNRQVTFVAAYRLAREAGADHKAAFEQATKATYDGHFDYGAANRPRIMQGNVAKVLLLFKQYGQNMVYTLSRNAYQSIKGTDAEKAEARKVLAGLLTSHAMAAGVLGLPMVTTLLAAASMIGGDDDEPWDAKVALQNLLADTFGQKPAEVLAHGLSRLTPWDISGRVGLDRLIFPDVQEGLEGQRLAESAMAAALGPVAGIGVNVLKGAQHMSEGRYALGLEAMLPSALRGPVKAIRYANEGVQDKSGISILDEVSPAAVAGQALGFSPSAARNAQEGKSAVMAHDRALGERRQELLTRAARASMAKDAEALDDARKEIARFNEKNPTRRITPLNVLQSVRNRNKRIDQAQDGVYLPKSRRDAMQAGRFALAESE